MIALCKNARLLDDKVPVQDMKHKHTKADLPSNFVLNILWNAQ
jgi:hypothetical protein